MTRTCTYCRETKALTDFVRKGAAGYHYTCKPCRAAQRRAVSPEVKRRWRQAARRAHPEQRAAARTVAKALKDGRLVRPGLCESCHKPGRIQAHHDDYSKRLDVRWLCHSCHMDLHVQLRQEARDAQAA